MQVSFKLEPIEARVLGVLIEKQLTTPDQYPLSLNALVNGVNQKVNREPVMVLEEEQVWSAAQQLIRKHLVEIVYPGGSRVEKYRHKTREMLGIDPVGLAIIGELLLRGPETPGELRARAGRMVSIASIDELLTALQPLIDKGYVKRLPPSPGSRADRYGQLIAPDAHPVDAPTPGVVSVVVSGALEARVTALEEEVASLRALLNDIEARIRGGG